MLNLVIEQHRTEIRRFSLIIVDCLPLQYRLAGIDRILDHRSTLSPIVIQAYLAPRKIFGTEVNENFALPFSASKSF